MAPILPPGQTVRVACGQCRMCRADRLDGFIGRCLAEQSTSLQTVAITLTYGSDADGETPANAGTLVYSDVQKFLKRLRKSGLVFSQVVVGEYGSRKGRAHWHAALFIREGRLDLPFDERFNWSFWPHGLTYIQKPDYGGFRYMFKYILDQKRLEVSVKSVRVSKRPPIGDAYFRNLAREMVELRLAMHNPSYSFSDVRRFNKTNRRYVPRTYWLNGAVRHSFMEEYWNYWKIRWGEEVPIKYWTDFLVERYLDPIAKAEIEAERLEGLESELAARSAEYEAKRARAEASRVSELSDHQIGFLTIDDPVGLVILFDDGRVRIRIGEEDPWLLDARKDLERQIDAIPCLAIQRRRAICQWVARKFPM